MKIATAQALASHGAAIAWAVLAATILGYELSAPPGQLLSNGVDRLLVSQPALAYGAVGVTALHLLNVFDRFGLEVIDPFHQAGLAGERIRRRERRNR